MRIITCASYYGSGSSAITDLISEYSSVYSFTDEEFRFVQDPYGIADLEYNLVENFNRHNSGYALKQYKKMVDFYCGNFINPRYEKYFKGNWKKYSYQYIDNLTDFKYHGWWQYDLLDKGKFYYFLKRVPNKLLKKTIWHNDPERTLDNMKKEITYCSHPTEEKFLSETQDYLNNLFKSIIGNKSTIMVDQLFPSTNISRYIRYVKNGDVRVFVVDRDPRDIYILEKYVWKDGIIPTDVQKFCKWFLYTRKNRQKELKDKVHVMYIQFEDLIYHYNETVDKIEKWLNLSPKQHIYLRKYFNPSKSIENTHLWTKYNVSVNDMEYIEKSLRGYLYENNTTTRNILE